MIGSLARSSESECVRNTLCPRRLGMFFPVRPSVKQALLWLDDGFFKAQNLSRGQKNESPVRPVPSAPLFRPIRVLTKGHVRSQPASS